MKIQSKKIIIIGECGGIPSESIAQCVQACEAKVVFQTTQFFV